MIYIDNNSIIEGYDARYQNTSFEKCAEFCKTTSGCLAFAYDVHSKTCYPSKETLFGPSADAIFKDGYSIGHTKCRKLNPIVEPTKKLSIVQKRGNSIYSCVENDNLQPQLYLHDKGIFKRLDEGRNIDDIFGIEDYSINSFTWPTNRFNLNQLDLLKLEKDKRRFTSDTVTDIQRVTKGVVQQENKINITDRNVLEDSLNNPLSIGVTNIYKVTDDYNKGEYLKSYKCINNIPLKSCLKYCTVNDNCAGIEWNPSFENRNNVCCPMRNIGKYIPRTDKYKYGKFYLKDKETKFDKSKIYVYY